MTTAGKTTLGDDLTESLTRVLDCAVEFVEADDDARESIGTLKSICDSYTKAMEIMEGLLTGKATKRDVRAFLIKERGE